jgi:phage N-6-adenine-methyltransferase
VNKGLQKTLVPAKRHDWETPQALFDELDAEFHFEVDVCATHANAKCSQFYTEGVDGLRVSWRRRMCWMNPPYGRKIVLWLKKAYEESLAGATVVCLVPAKTDTRWWHEYCMKGEIRFIKGRLNFVGCKHNAPFPSAIVIFKASLSQ